MAERRTNGGEARPYKVGRGRPPVHSQFKPGQSGNPAGRKKGSRNVGTDVRRMLALPIAVKVNGRTRKVSTQTAALLMLREKALRGDLRALAHMLELACRYHQANAGETPQALPANDQAILAAFVADQVAAAKAAVTHQTRAPKARIPSKRSKPNERP